ncbi:MAG: ABC transporter ATP-binding protein [Myxococcaceae bacterium]|nr:ABC transporter ATP-binding protein [Myxococcaceae bacterium]
MPLLEIHDLHVTFRTPEGPVHAVDGVDFTLERGRTLALVGESGSGKSVSSLALMGLLPSPPAIVRGGPCLFEGISLLEAPEAERRRLRGNRMAMIFQDPMTALNPFLTIGRQLTEVLEVHRGVEGRPARARAEQMLHDVGLADPSRAFDQYPHEFSGGMRQRVMIAMALLLEPSLVIADEPTTGLDVTVQAQILALLKERAQKNEAAVLLITHDLGVVAGTADEVAVMYAGRIVEHADVDTLFRAPRHPYTRGLLQSLPRLDSTPKVELSVIPGHPPDPVRLPAGCPFRPRCRVAVERCAHERPALQEVAPGQRTACFVAEGA